MLVLCVSAVLQAAERVDLSKLERTIDKELTYISDEQLYGLVVIGNTASNRIWMVLDKSEADNVHYDVL